ncbi:hypothetical protein CDL15_Pgr008704 [Punica granatum]|uniref:Uncharacterized protein n=1 Tax=Punica granatum TaxID=22663 RepID=A0A218WC79_PUNGR|nr:hypothetical protein CDL15_Pgr008704 [Punica granatum]
MVLIPLKALFLSMIIFDPMLDAFQHTPMDEKGFLLEIIYSYEIFEGQRAEDIEMKNNLSSMVAYELMNNQLS